MLTRFWAPYVPKYRSEACDISLTGASPLVRELAIGLGPLVRINGVGPAALIAGSAMFSRERVILALRQYAIEFTNWDSMETPRTRLTSLFTQRTFKHQPILPMGCASGIFMLAGDRSSKTTDHIIPVDGRLPEAFVRLRDTPSTKEQPWI